ncbi:pyridoxal phosphate-dependent aminotransferase [Deminuibacter soli]|uniref:Aminotransferase n=1 Tax=Deminuibacter soli TaxID=2291815 RepID=A0A3E1NLL2_9BACT|nr:pyridoxal phosphate-dependent aminotransferase [Deminuibacter soli]RFM28734.1 pyridoxal phosphate-dependent aminotransferase [Deminuibacter soli]
MQQLQFNEAEINMPALRKRAYNLRWATLPEQVIPLTAADPDFQCAPEIAEAINAYTNERVFAYGPGEGLPSFRQTIAATMRSRRNINTHADLVLPVDSAAQGMFVIARYCLQPGDEAIIFDPVDFLFKRAVQAAGGVPVYFPIDVATGSFDMNLLQSLVTPKTRLICLCNPHNPSGKVFTREELTAIGEFAVANDLWIMSDEIWSDIVFAPSRYTSIASVSPAIAAHTITVYGFSKSFGLAGLRVGFILSPNALVHAGIVETSLVDTTAYGVSTISQVAGQAAYEKAWYWVEAFIQHLTQMRDVTIEKLNAMPGITCHTPQGCYLAFPDIRATGMNSETLTAYLLEHAQVAVVPGAEKWFGPGAEGHIRICFSTSRKILTEGLDRIAHALQKL